MKTIKFIALTALSVAIATAACGDSDDGTGGGTPTGATTSTGGGGTGGNPGGGGAGGGEDPPPPTLGTQIDRKGRPAIATATYQRFVDPQVHADDTDAWNADDDAVNWASSYFSNVASQIAILDGINSDGVTGCDDQLLYAGIDPAPVCPDDGNEACYGAFATVLTNDWLILNLAGADDPGYLGAEANVLGVPGDSKGGRMPAHDVIDISYSILTGLFDFSDPDPFFVSDGVDAPPQAQVESFPYLADPN